MSTAKYIAEKNNIILNVDERLGERRFGVNNISELPSTFFEDQFRNWDYKLTNGESVNEVSKRMNEALSEILDVNRDKKIAIISHGTAISAMLKKWCNIKLNEETKLVEIYFNNKLVFDGNWKCPELFKLEFDDNNNLISIKNIKFK
ncbi:phosphoglycerate mutase family protein [Clostridium sp. CAG:710]|nr:phosphoglycerate mutase family protein [Clostridium sp. CAG:710]